MGQGEGGTEGPIHPGSSQLTVLGFLMLRIIHSNNTNFRPENQTEHQPQGRGAVLYQPQG